MLLDLKVSCPADGVAHIVYLNSFAPIFSVFKEWHEPFTSQYKICACRGTSVITEYNCP